MKKSLLFVMILFLILVSACTTSYKDSIPSGDEYDDTISTEPITYHFNDRITVINSRKLANYLMHIEDDKYYLSKVKLYSNEKRTNEITRITDRINDIYVGIDYSLEVEVSRNIINIKKISSTNNSTIELDDLNISYVNLIEKNISSGTLNINNSSLINNELNSLKELKINSRLFNDRIIKTSTFSENSNVQIITISGDIEKIELASFEKLSNIEKIIVNGNVKEIEDYAFQLTVSNFDDILIKVNGTVSKYDNIAFSRIDGGSVTIEMKK